MTPAEIIAKLAMQPHPEGGHFVEIYREPTEPRGTLSSIYFLLQAGERSHWHRVRDAAEIWAWHAGDPLRLSIAGDRGPLQTVTLGAALERGEQPQAVVPADAWQAAESMGDWTLVGCIVAPAFSFDGFEMAPPDWRPPEVD